jgi:hypothetical protein
MVADRLVGTKKFEADLWKVFAPEIRFRIDERFDEAERTLAHDALFDAAALERLSVFGRSDAHSPTTARQFRARVERLCTAPVPLIQM